MAKAIPAKKDVAKKKKPVKKTLEDEKVEKSKKRRERRQSRSTASKRRERQEKRKSDGLEGKGKGKGKQVHTIQGGVVVVTKDKEFKMAFNKAAMDMINARKRNKVQPKQLTPSVAFLDNAVSMLSSTGYFGDLPVQGPPGQFINVSETLEILSKIEKKTTTKKSKDTEVDKPEQTEELAEQDKPNKGALDRARKLLQERSSTLPIFDLLRDQSQAKRDEGISKITALLKTHLKDKELPADAKPSKLDKIMGSIPSYILTRLIKGLSSSAGGARLGFTQALSAILVKTQIPTDYFLTQLDNFLPTPPKNELGPEQKQTAWGVAFGCLAVMSSGRKMERVVIMTLVEKLTSISEMLAPVRELCASLLAHLIDTCDAAITQKAILPKVSERYFSSKIEAWSAEAVFLYVKLYRSEVSIPESLSTVFTHSMASEEVAAKFSKVLLEGKQSAFAFYPRMHMVWDEWMGYISKGSVKDKTKGSHKMAERLRVMWNAIIVEKLSTVDDRKYKALSEYLVSKVVDIIIKSSVAHLPDRTALLADLGRTHPGITTELLRRCSSSETAPLKGRDPKAEAEGLMKQLFELNSTNIKEKLQVGDEEMKVQDESESDSNEDEDMKSGDEEEEEEPVMEEEGDREGYNRFAFNMRKVILSEMKKLALTEGLLQEHPGAFQTIGQFFLTHAFFTVPEGAVDGDGFMSMETFTSVLRNECADHLYSLIKHYHSQASGTRTEAAAVRKVCSNVLPNFVKHYQRLTADVGSQALYEQIPETEKILKKIGKFVSTGSGKCAQSVKGSNVVDAHHKPHVEALLCLQFFTVVVEGPELADSEDILESISTAVADVGKIFTSGQYVAKDLLDTMLSMNIRMPSEAAQHLAAVTNKVSLAIMEHMVSDHLKSASDIEVLMSPLNDESFTVVEDGVDPEAMGIDDEEEEEDEDEEIDAEDPKANKAAIEKQMKHARMRCLQFLQAYLNKTKSATPYVGAIAGPIARIAELSLPRITKSKGQNQAWGEKDVSQLQNASPVLSGCCAVLLLLSKCPLSGQVKEWKKAYPELAKEALAALESLSAIYCKDKEKMQEKEGKHLKVLLIKTIMTLVGIVHLAEGDIIIVHSSIENILKTRSLSSQFTEAVLGLYGRCPSAVGLGVLPPLASVLSDQSGRPFHRKVLFEIASTLSSKWTFLEQLKASSPTSHASTVLSLTNCARAFNPASDTDSWRSRVAHPPAIQLLVTVSRYLEKTNDECKKSFFKKAKQTIETFVNNATVIDVDTKAALRKAWEHIKPALDYSDTVQVKPRKPVVEVEKQEVDTEASRKRKRESDEKAVEAEKRAAEQKHSIKKARKEKKKAEIEKEKAKFQDEKKKFKKDKPAEEPKKAKKERKEKKGKKEGEKQ
eukprot:TRINITY_DN362_c7_g1_i1.p1 TRINITY_DN362_c7_g1~~TRINITY_DN362_c7_g1_i1.p1  ORF type:complete len:1411 (+),score=471.08 TRINITY_DN362_c7_g1_i1:94-4233(+)